MVWLPPSSPKVELAECTVNGVSAQCGKHTVYENRATQNGRQIELNIVVLPATGEQAAPDPLSSLQADRVESHLRTLNIQDRIKSLE